MQKRLKKRVGLFFHRAGVKFSVPKFLSKKKIAKTEKEVHSLSGRNGGAGENDERGEGGEGSVPPMGRGYEHILPTTNLNVFKATFSFRVLIGPFHAQSWRCRWDFLGVCSHTTHLVLWGLNWVRSLSTLLCI